MTALETYRKSIRIHTDLADETAVSTRLADAAIESLKCCGNCQSWSQDSGPTSCFVEAHYEPGGGWSQLHAVQPPDACHFTPSRWDERITP